MIRMLLITTVFRSQIKLSNILDLIPNEFMTDRTFYFKFLNEIKWTLFYMTFCTILTM